MSNIQHQASDRQAAQALHDLLEGPIPEQSLLNGLNGHSETVDAVMEGFRDNGITGAKAVFNILAKKDQSLYTLLSEYDPNATTDPDYTTTEKGKRVFKALSMDEIDELPD